MQEGGGGFEQDLVERGHLTLILCYPETPVDSFSHLLLRHTGKDLRVHIDLLRDTKDLVGRIAGDVPLTVS